MTTPQLPLAIRWVPQLEPCQVVVIRADRPFARPRIGTLLGRNMLGDTVMQCLVEFEHRVREALHPAECRELATVWGDNVIPFPQRPRGFTSQVPA